MVGRGGTKGWERTAKMTNKARIGLLPLYLDLYDTALPEIRPRMEAFYGTIAAELERRGLEIIRVGVCRLEHEFATAVRTFEEAQADAIVTLHLAYSPSLESSAVLARTRLPLIVLDTTPARAYGPDQDPAELMFNHGIHGVQDMCNLLIRRGKQFEIEAGHWRESDVLDRVVAWARAARLATRMRTAKVGLIGEPFRGMGDFEVRADVLEKTIGVQTVPCDRAALCMSVPPPEAPEVQAEMAADAQKFAVEGVSVEAHRRTVRAGLGVRGWIERQGLSAFTFNFLSLDQASGIPTVPFLEASKAMARGLGYAGEGDVLTAALVGALASVYGETTFTEMFCPDWAGDRIFVSHMGEMNVDLAGERPRLRQMPFPWTDAESPVIAVGRFRSGIAVLVNLAPGRESTYTLIVAPVTMVDAEGEDRMTDLIHGWFRPKMPIADFLSAFSRAGGTHHSALVYGEVAEEVARFGRLMGWKVMPLEAPGE